MTTSSVSSDYCSYWEITVLVLDISLNAFIKTGKANLRECLGINNIAAW